MSAQDITKVSEQHPYYGGVEGVVEGKIGPHNNIFVLSRIRESEDDPKIFFMVRPDDVINLMKMQAELAAQEVTEPE